MAGGHGGGSGRWYSWGTWQPCVCGGASCSLPQGPTSLSIREAVRRPRVRPLAVLPREDSFLVGLGQQGVGVGSGHLGRVLVEHNVEDESLLPETGVCAAGPQGPRWGP